MSRRYIVVIAIIVLLCAGAYMAFAPHGASAPADKRPSLTIGGQTVRIDIADNDPERARGLGGRAGLEDTEGMLFIFENEGMHSFWMKDMRFSIDMVWLDSDKRIIYIEENVSPETFPQSFGPSELSRFVIELPAGWIKSHNVRVGETVAF